MKHVVDGAYISEWLLLGPFFPDDLEQDFLAHTGGEAHANPEAGDTVTTAEGNTLTWEPYRTKGNIIDLLHAIGDYQNATAYAFCVLHCETAGDVQLHLGSDDGIVVWLNGECVHRHPAIRPMYLDADEVEARLVSGANRCLVKISQGTDDWCFAIRGGLLSDERARITGTVTDEHGTPISSAAVDLTQDGCLLAEARTDKLGGYHLNIWPVEGQYDLSATSQDLGCWRLGLRLSEGERRHEDFQLSQASSIEGRVLMCDNLTPHVALPIQAVEASHATAAPTSAKCLAKQQIAPEADQLRPPVTTLTNSEGKYRLTNLRPGEYLVRCQALDSLICHRSQSSDDSDRDADGSSASADDQDLQIKHGECIQGVDFRLARFKRGWWKNHSYIDGLADNRVHAIYREPNGGMWFGTEGGVSHYDGKTFTNFTARDGLADDVVFSIHQNPDGTMWFGTHSGGVSRYDGTEFVNLTTQQGLIGDWVSAVYQDSDGDMWFATMGGVSKFDGHTFTNFTVTDGLAHHWAYAIHQDPDGTMWFATYGGLSRFDGETFVNFTMKDGLVSNGITSIYREPNGALWLGTSAGISSYDGERFVNLTTRDGLVHNMVFAVGRDADGFMWFGTRGGVSRYDGGRFTNFTTEDGLSHDMVSAIHSDPDGVMWFGTNGGVSCYDSRRLVNLTTQDGLCDAMVTDIQPLPDGTLWFSTLKGVSLYNNEGLTAFTTRDGLVHDRVKCLQYDHSGMLWFGTENGVSRYDGEQFVDFTTEDGLAYDWVNTIHCDPDGVLWFGTSLGGVSRYDGERFVNYTTYDGLPDNWINAICRDSHGWIWFATRSGGVSRYDGKQFVNFTTEDGLAHNRVTAILCDQDGVLWFGTGGGVSRYDGKQFVNFTTEDGLAHNRVTAIHCDQDGVLWFGTLGAGISLYDGVAWACIDTRDGLLANDVTSICEMSDGSLWFGTQRGITRYRRGATPPLTRISAVTTDHRYTDLASLKPATTGTRVTFEYTSIDFSTHPDKRQYRHRLAGYEDTWSQPARSAEVDYVSLPVGEYTFQVQAIDCDLCYSESSATVHLDVLPNEAEEALKASEDKYRRILERLISVYYHADLEGTLLLVSPSGAKLLGYDSPDSMLGKNLALDFYYNPEDRHAFLGALKEHGEIMNYAVTLRRIDGTPVAVETNSSFLYDEAGKPIGVEGTLRDVTERNQAEQALREREVAEQIQSAKMESLRQLVAGVAHEINNPAGIIVSSSDVARRAIHKLTERLAQELDENAEYARTFAILEDMNQTNRSAAERIADMIANLRRFVRLDEAEWQMANIHACLDNAIALAQMEPDFISRIRVVRDYTQTPRIYCSPGSLNQVFMHILRNASEAIEGEGEIKIRTSTHQGHIRIAISDTGHGIPSADVGRVFDPGFTTKGTGIGVGLGLSICYQIIVDGHKGHFEASSELGIGTDFMIDLPLRLRSDGTGSEEAR